MVVSTCLFQQTARSFFSKTEIAYEGKLEKTDNGAGKITYPEAFGSGTYVEYINTEGGVKENIVLEENTGQNRFDFIFRSDTHTPVLVNDGQNILVADKDNLENVQYRFLSLYAFDLYKPEAEEIEQTHSELARETVQSGVNNQEYKSEELIKGKEKKHEIIELNEIINIKEPFRHLNEECHYELTDNGNGEYIITVVVPEEYLNHPETVYPVTIDPSVTRVSNNSNSHDTYVLQKSPNSNYGSRDYLQFGYNGGKIFSYWKINSLGLPQNSTVTSANLKLTFRSGQTTSSTGQCYRVAAKNWSEGSLTWANQPYGYNMGATSSHNNCKYYSFNITEMVKFWHANPSQNYGLDFTYTNETHKDYNTVVSSEGEAHRAPVLTINYNVPSQTSGIVDGAIYNIKSVYSSKYLQGGTYKKAPLVQNSFTGEPNQQWQVKYLGNGTYNFIPQHKTDYRMGIDRSIDANGSSAEVYPPTGSGGQTFRIISNGDSQGSYRIQPLCSSTRVLDVRGPSTANNNPIQLWTWNPKANQMKWTFHRVSNYGYKGFAVYRHLADFMSGLPNWHSGLMDEPNASCHLPVIHVQGLYDVVDWDSWKDFVGKDTFYGVYRPKKIMSDADRGSVIAMARRLRNENINYTVTAQMSAAALPTANKITPDKIYNLRCDGLLEYCYEYYGYRIYGDDKRWDISKASGDNIMHHAGNPLVAGNISPKVQAQKYMVRVTTNEPR